MPSSRQTPTYKFLFDENVRQELYKFLKAKNIDVKLAVKGSSDQALLVISKSEKRILVTNDQDFSQYSKNEAYAAIWLRIPQNDEEALLKSFDKLISEVKNFASKLIMLHEGRWEILPLAKELND